MELFKTSAGSWTYPEANLFRLGGVPLFSGFMYAAVGSYLARVTRIFDFHFSHYPPTWATVALAAGIYANFFTHHYGPDLRLLLFAATALLFGAARCTTRLPLPPPHEHAARLLPRLPLHLVCREHRHRLAHLIYPNQQAGWSMVSLGKLSSWYLLMNHLLRAGEPRPPPEARRGIVSGVSPKRSSPPSYG